MTNSVRAISTPIYTPDLNLYGRVDNLKALLEAREDAVQELIHKLSQEAKVLENNSGLIQPGNTEGFTKILTQAVSAISEHIQNSCLKSLDISPYVNNFENLSETSLGAWTYGRLFSQELLKSSKSLYELESLTVAYLNSSSAFWTRAGEIRRGLTQKEDIFPTESTKPSVEVHSVIESLMENIVKWE